MIAKGIGIGVGLVGYGIYTAFKWGIAIGGAPFTGGGSLILFGVP